jgi:hypothetical protein
MTLPVALRRNKGNSFSHAEKWDSKGKVQTLLRKAPMDFLAILREERARAKASKAGQNLNEGGNESKEGQKSQPKSAEVEISLNVELTLPPAESRKDFELLDSGDLVYFPRVVSEGGEKALLDAVNKQAEIQSWTLLTGRKSIMCGNHHNASGESVSQSLPVWLQGLCNQLPFFDSIDESNSVLINSYQAGDGEIAFHTDGPSYLPMVCILSLGGPIILSFRERVRTEDIGVKEDLGDMYVIILLYSNLFSVIVACLFACYLSLSIYMLVLPVCILWHVMSLTTIFFFFFFLPPHHYSY